MTASLRVPVVNVGALVSSPHGGNGLRAARAAAVDDRGAFSVIAPLRRRAGRIGGPVA